MTESDSLTTPVSRTDRLREVGDIIDRAPMLPPAQPQLWHLLYDLQVSRAGAQ